LPITGATAADYSPDSLKAFIVAGDTLYVYSTLEALKTIPLAAPANQVSFLANGAFAYLSGGTPSSVSAYTTCSNTLAGTAPTPQTPTFLQSLPNGVQVLGVDSPGIDLINVSSAPVGCSPTLTNTVQSFNLGQGNFVPVQLVVSQDGTQAFVIANDVGSVLVFDVGNQTSSAIPLTGHAVPVQASLTADGTQLYVAANDGLIHLLDTQTGGDIAQISIPSDPNTLQAGLCVGTSFICNPDLIAVKP
jgi:WD40 repeat protein